MNVVARSATESSKQASERITRDVLSLDPGVQSGSAGSGWTGTPLGPASCEDQHKVFRQDQCCPLSVSCRLKKVPTHMARQALIPIVWRLWCWPARPN
jgi:hypothetical protein